MIKEFYNCDCMELMKGMGDKSVGMILTDIPYELHEHTIYKNIAYYLVDQDGNTYKGGYRGQKVEWGDKCEPTII